MEISQNNQQGDQYQINTTQNFDIHSETFSKEENLIDKIDQLGTSNDFAAFINIFKTYIGVGILAMPYAYYYTGYILSTIVLSLIAICVIIVMNYLDQVCDEKKINNINIFSEVLGETSLNVYKFFFVFYEIGVCVAYVIFFVQFFESAFDAPDNSWSRMGFLILALCVIVPMNLIKDFSIFTNYSKIANIFCLVTLFMVFEMTIEIYIQDSPQVELNERDYSHFHRISGFFGIALFAFESNGLSFTIKNSMKNPQNFTKIFTNTTILVCAINMVFSLFCCLAFGNQTSQIILIGLQQKRPYFFLFQLLYSINLAMSYPLQLFPVIKIIDEIQIVKDYVTENPSAQYIPRFIITGIIFLVACITPQFAIFLNLVGAFAGTFIQFIFPLLVYHVYYKSRVTKKIILINIIIFLFILIGSTSAIYKSILDLL